MPSQTETDQAKQRREKLAEAVHKFAGQCDADIILINSPMDRGVDTTLIRRVSGRRRRKNVFLILVTEGGDANAAYRIARCLQQAYEHFVVVVPGWCKSAGTLVCIGAHDLIISDLGELGPLDVQLAKPDELGLISSGLTFDSAFRSLQSVAFQMFETFLLDTLKKSGGRITTKTAAELAATITTGMLAPVFQQMDPMKIGEDFRSTRIAAQYAVRLDAVAKNLSNADEENDPIEALVRGYPSHGFVIDREEASSLFQRVYDLDDIVDGLLAEIVSALGDAVLPSSRARPMVRYLTQEVPANDQQPKQPGTATSGPEPSPRGGGGTNQNGPEPVPQNPPKGDGNVAVSVSDRSSRKSRSRPTPN